MAVSLFVSVSIFVDVLVPIIAETGVVLSLFCVDGTFFALLSRVRALEAFTLFLELMSFLVDEETLINCPRVRVDDASNLPPGKRRLVVERSTVEVDMPSSRPFKVKTDRGDMIVFFGIV